MNSGKIPTRKLGRTGVEVSCIGLGGSHIGKSKLLTDEAVHLIRSAIDEGITFMDNSWDYNDGESDRRYAKALKDGYRQKAFLMTKIDGRDKKTAAKQIDDCLRRMEVDHIDLLQHHEVIRFDDADRIFAEDGANQAVLEAQKAGKIRFIGFTGHKDPHVHLNMLRVADEHGFSFDTVQMPLNVMDAHYRSFTHMVLPELVKRDIGVLGMKSLGDGVILKAKSVSAPECLRYSLSLPTSVVITGIDKEEILKQALTVARGFKPMDSDEKNELLARAQQHAMKGKYELFKTSALFDSTAENPKWLGEDSETTKQLMAQ